MSHTMNGKPVWCPPARQRDYTFDPIQTKEDQVTVTLAEAAGLVRAAIRRGLIKTAEQCNPGARSHWITCTQCKIEFTRGQKSKETRCQVCRLARKNCILCGSEFQPTTKAQACCGHVCRDKQIGITLTGRGRGFVTVKCKWCQKDFEKLARDKKTHCTRECGLKTMAEKRKIALNENKTQQFA